MSAGPQEWVVHPHGPIERLEPNLWTVSGPPPGFPVPMTRIMSVVRLSDGRLLIHSAIALERGEQGELESLGEPAFLVVPNRFHRFDAARYKARYPELRVLCPAAARPQVERVVAVDGDYADLPLDPVIDAEGIQGFGLRDGSPAEGVFRVDSDGGRTLIFNDVLINQPHMPGLLGRIYRGLGATGRPRVAPHLLFVAGLIGRVDRAALRAQLARLAETPGLRRIIPGHGERIEEQVPQVLREVAADVGREN